MEKLKEIDEKGQSLVEVLVALGVFVIGVVAVGVLVIDAGTASRQGVERTQAVLLAREGLEAARSIRDADFDNLSSGSHGVVLSGDTWGFSGTSDTQDQFTRTITITSLDVDTKQVESSVTWQFTEARQSSVVFTDYLTDWNQTHGNAGELSVNIDDVEINNKKLEDLKIENTGGSDITIDKITVWWDNSNLIEKIRVDGDDIWKHNGEGTPDGQQPSGTELDVVDYTVEAGEGLYNIDEFRFDNSMSGTAFIILFTMTDGSTKYVLIESGVASCGPEADNLVIDASGAVIGGKGNKELKEITIENIHSSCDITIDKITTWWDNSNLIEEIEINNTKVWRHNHEGTPDGRQPSGTELDVVDYILTAGSTDNIDKFKFNGDMSGATFSITFTMSDGTTKSVTNFSP